MNHKEVEIKRDAAIERVRDVLAMLNDAVAAAMTDILQAAKVSAEPENAESLIPLFKALRRREGEREHARDLLAAMEASK